MENTCEPAGVRALLERLQAAPGEVSLYYRRLDCDCEALEYRADLPLVAASVIKIPVMLEAFRQIKAGALDADREYAVHADQKLPSCGALTYMHDGLRVTLMDLITLMIILSDNTATNMVIDLVGMENVNRTLGRLGAEKTVLRRRLFDAEASARGVENTISAREIGGILEKLYRGELVSPEASAAMLRILGDQRLNGKFPFYLHALGCRLAHKTGEDDGITHDAGIVFAPHPFVLCMFSNHTDVPGFERLMQDAALELYRINT